MIGVSNHKIAFDLEINIPDPETTNFNLQLIFVQNLIFPFVKKFNFILMSNFTLNIEFHELKLVEDGWRN